MDTCWLWDIPNDNADKGLDGIGNAGYLLKSFNFAIDPRRSFSCFFTNKKSFCVYHVGLKNGGFNHIKWCLSIKMAGSIHDNWALASAYHILPWQGTPKGSGQEAMCPWRLMTVSSFGWKLRKATGSFKETSKRIRYTIQRQYSDNTQYVLNRLNILHQTNFATQQVPRLQGSSLAGVWARQNHAPLPDPEIETHLMATMPGISKTTKSDQKHPKTTFQRRKDQGLWECASRSQGISKKQWLTKNDPFICGENPTFSE